MNDEEIAKKISDQNEKVPCLFCDLNVLRSDMPRVGVCKICYAKEPVDEKGVRLKFIKLPTWHDFFRAIDKKHL